MFLGRECALTVLDCVLSSPHVHALFVWAQVRELWIEGEHQVGSLLVAKSYYFGGIEVSVCWLCGMHVWTDGCMCTPSFMRVSFLFCA